MVVDSHEDDGGGGGGSSSETPKKKDKSTSYFYGITNPEWLVIKAMYFSLYGVIGAMIPFIILFYLSRGLAPSQIGVIELMVRLVGLVSRPIFGGIADKTGRHTMVLGVSVLVFSGFVFALIFVKPTPPNHIRYPINLNCDESSHKFTLEACDSAESILLNVSLIQPNFVLHHSALGFQRNCSSVDFGCQVVCRNFEPIKSQIDVGTAVEPFAGLGLRLGGAESKDQCSVFPVSVAPSHNYVTLVCNNTYSMPCDIDCICSKNKTEIDSSSYSNIEEEDAELTENRRTFLILFIIRVVGAIPFGPSTSLADSLTYDLLGHKHRLLWGQQRMFGTLSWGIAAATLGILVDVSGSFDCVFLTSGGFGIISSLIVLFALPRKLPRHHHGDKTNHDSVDRPLPFFSALANVFKIPLFVISCLVSVGSGLLLSVIFVPAPMYLTQELGGPKMLIGALSSMASGVEVLSFFFAGAVVSRLGEVACFLLMYAAYTVKFLAYSFLTPSIVWLALTFEISHMFCFAFYFTAASRFAASIAPPGTSATVQAIQQTSFFGVGMGFGNLIASFIYQIYGGRLTCQIYSAFAAFCFFALLILYYAYLRKEIVRFRSQHKPAHIVDIPPPITADPNFIEVDENEDDDNDEEEEKIELKKRDPEQEAGEEVELQTTEPLIENSPSKVATNSV